jgi:hypothetical protein
LDLDLTPLLSTRPCSSAPVEIVAGNVRGRRAHERLGFREEGLLREQVFKGGRYIDVVRAGLLADEFNAARDQLRSQLGLL